MKFFFSIMGKSSLRLNAAPKVTEKSSRTGNKTHICSFPSPRLSHLLSQLVSQPVLFWAGFSAGPEGAYGTDVALPAGSQVRLVEHQGAYPLPGSKRRRKTCYTLTQPWLCPCPLRRKGNCAGRILTLSLTLLAKEKTFSLLWGKFKIHR